MSLSRTHHGPMFSGKALRAPPMPELKEPIPAPPSLDDLDSRVDSLLRSAQEAVDRVERTLSPESPQDSAVEAIVADGKPVGDTGAQPEAKAPAAPAPSPAAAAPAAPIDSPSPQAPVAPNPPVAVADPVPVSTPATPAPVAAEPSAAANELDRQLEELLEPETAEATIAAAEAPLEEPTPKDIQSLDSDLAALTDNLLSEEVPAADAPPAAPLVEEAPEPAPEPVAQAPAAAESPAPVEAKPEPKPEARSEPKPEPRQTTVQPAEPKPVVKPAPKPARTEPARPAAKELIAAAVQKAASPVALQVMAGISAPLAGRSRAVKDTVGWLALWTAFLAVTLWTYILFFHKPQVPPASGTPIGLVDEKGKPKAVAHAEGATPAEGEHAKPESEGPASGGTAKPAAKPAAGDHGAPAKKEH